MLPLDRHIWVSASAGSGKTTTLTNRVLQLLLHDARPSSILCITYTNAAAAEMKQRVIQRLGQWVVCADDQLEQEISAITGTVSEAMRRRARGLFFAISEQPESLNIQTIHGFCQSILRRFPLEAGVSPYFKVIDEERADQLIAQTFDGLMRDIERGKLPEAQEAMARWMASMSDVSIRDAMHEAMKESHRWRQWLGRPEQLPLCKDKLAALMEVGGTPAPLPDVDELRALHTFFAEGRYAAHKAVAGALADFLALVAPDDDAHDRLARAWLTQKYQPIKALLKGLEQQPDVEAAVHKHMEWALAWLKAREHQQKFALSCSLYELISVLWQRYQRLCAQRGYLDFHDLLYLTQQFLSRDATTLGWVMYKLDGGIYHVLVDEAQDTNPLGWDIITALTAEFFSGKGRVEQPRTLFVVGDEKQSIFGFQGADVGRYRSMKHWLKDNADAAGQAFEEVALNRSYRSSKAVINMVNRVCEALEFNAPHVAHRHDVGAVEQWPLAEAQSADGQQRSAQQVLAQHIAGTIEGWLKDKRQIPGLGRAIQPEDVLVLVRTRGAFSYQLASDLRARAIAVQGVEHMVLPEHLAVQDMLALMQWCLQPADDYALACVLRSPFFSISEQQLYEWSVGRGDEALWGYMCLQDNLADIIIKINKYQWLIGSMGVYDAMHHLLYAEDHMQAFEARMGRDAVIALELLLAKAQAFEAISPSEPQLFIEYIKQQHLPVKLHGDMTGALRIMTVHGSKGLEAPVVIMADTTSAVRPQRGLTWLEHNGQDVPCWLPSKDLRQPQLAHSAELATQKSSDEDARLLYVAMTRARDELYIAGYKGRSSVESCWYEQLKSAAKA